MTGGIERVRDVLALCPTGRTVHVQSDDVRDVLAALDQAEGAIVSAHAALATERERAGAAEALRNEARAAGEWLRAELAATTATAVTRAEAAEKTLATLTTAVRGLFAAQAAASMPIAAEDLPALLLDFVAGKPADEGMIAKGRALVDARAALEAALARCP